MWRSCHCSAGACGRNLESPDAHRPVNPLQTGGLATMGPLLVLLAFFLLLGVASALGFSVDSRDGADWRPSAGGFRAGPR